MTTDEKLDEKLDTIIANQTAQRESQIRMEVKFDDLVEKVGVHHATLYGGNGARGIEADVQSLQERNIATRWASMFDRVAVNVISFAAIAAIGLLLWVATQRAIMAQVR